MAELTFDEDTLAATAAQLSPETRLAFALACTERLLPNYQAFTAQVGWGQPQTLRRALDLAWQVLVGAWSPTEKELASLEQDVISCEPETEDFDTVLVSSALDAACCAGHVLALVRSGEPDEMVAVASLARDTVDMYVQEAESMPPQAPDLEERIRLHPLMQAELQHQADLLSELSEGTGQRNFSAFMSRYKTAAMSNIGLPHLLA